MKFTVALQDFQELLNKTLPAIPPKSTLPILEHLHFSLEQGVLRVIATDQDITIMTSLQVETEEEGAILVPGRRSSEIIRALGNKGALLFSSNPDTFEIKMTTSNGQYAMKGLNPDEYLDIPELFNPGTPDYQQGLDAETESAILIKADDMSLLAGKTSFAVSKDEFRPAMTGVLFQFRSDRIYAAATDSYRLSRVIVENPDAVYPAELDLIFPARAVDLLKKVDDDVTMSLIESHDKITHTRFETGNSVIVTRIIDERFPPYENVIPQDDKFAAIVDKNELINSIRRVSIFANEISKQIRIKFVENQILITGRDEEIGTDGDEQIPCEYLGEPTEIGFNHKFLEEALGYVDPNQEGLIRLSFSEPQKPVIVKAGESEEKLLMLIMPVRIN